MPTILQYLHVPLPPGLQGKSLLSIILNKAGDAAAGDAYSESYYPHQFGWSALRALRHGRYKYIDAPRPELYDLEIDPAELENEIAGHQSVANDLKSRLETLLTRATPAPSAAALTSPPVDVELLRSLGYVGTSTPLAPYVSDRQLPDPKDKLAVFKRISAAAQLAAEGKCQQAAPGLERLARDEPSLFMAHYLLGQCRFAANQFEPAATAFDRAVRLRPENVEAIFYRAACAVHLGRLEAALVDLNLTLKLQPDYPYSHYYRGLVYQKQGRADNAAAEFEKCIQVDPEFEEAHYKFGYLLAQRGKFPEAIDHFKKVLALDPARAAAHFNLALAFVKSGDAAAARPEFDAACQLDSAFCKPAQP